jgi:pimeloyl-ACP methyl ester carboxylesterase
MVREVTTTLTAADGTPISAVHYPSLPRAGAPVAGDLCLVVVHGFTGHWRQERVQRVIAGLRPFGGVVALDMRGHGRSGGATTVGDEEVMDVEAAVAWARSLGYPRIATVGFSLGGAVVLREAALVSPPPDAVVSVSAPAFWFYRGTRIMRVAHWMVETRPGRALMRARRTRVSHRGWPDPYPIPPHEAAAQFPRIPLLIVHGDADHYFPLEHPQTIQTSAQGAASHVDLWIEPGVGHAEAAIPPETIVRMGEWVREMLALPAVVGTEKTEASS